MSTTSLVASPFRHTPPGVTARRRQRSRPRRPRRPEMRFLSSLFVVAVCSAGIGLSTNPADAAGPPWTLHTITSGPRGADGVHLGDVNDDGRQDVTSGWEQAGIVTVSLH